MKNIIGRSEWVSKADGAHIVGEYGREIREDGEFEYDHIFINDIELYAETPVIEGDEEWGGAFLIVTDETDRQAKEKGIDLDLYNPIYE